MVLVRRSAFGSTSTTTPSEDGDEFAEDVLVSVRVWQLLMVVLAGAVAGCGGDASQMQFAENAAVAKPVHRKARAVVEKTLTEHFGTPLNSVAWLKLPVNYGKADGTVKSVDGRSVLVAFNAETSDLESLKSPELTRAGLLFTSGTNAGKSFLLASYDASETTFETLDALQAAPAAGDQFVVAGQNLRHGRKLYARHCQHCHGVNGDGDGTTAQYLNPRPRDYRLGIFKFTSTNKDTKASREDLKRIVSQGIPGTYMPAFVPMLKDNELTSLIEYVRWLAMRGELEVQLLKELKNDFAADRAKKEAKEANSSVGEIEKQITKQLDEYVANAAEGLPAFLETATGDMVTAWEGAEATESVIMPPVPRVPDSAESRQRGKDLFLKDGKCINCHGPAGRGNGFQTEDYQKNDATGGLFEKRGLHDAWGQSIKPRDLTRGIYRGGRRPIDIYRRISQGIKGTPMPATPATVTPQQVWDLVNYVLSVPFESASPKPAKASSVPEHPAERGIEK